MKFKASLAHLILYLWPFSKERPSNMAMSSTQGFTRPLRKWRSPRRVMQGRHSPQTRRWGSRQGRPVSTVCFLLTLPSHSLSSSSCFDHTVCPLLSIAATSLLQLLLSFLLFSSLPVFSVSRLIPSPTLFCLPPSLPPSLSTVAINERSAAPAQPFKKC